MAFLSREGAVGFWRNGLMSVAAVTSMLAALLAFGGVVVGVWNLHHLLARAEAQLVAVAYLREGLSAAEVASARRMASNLRGVREVVFVSREEALRKLEQALGGVELEEVVRRNPLPHTLEVRPHRPGDLARVARSLRSIPGVEEVTYGEDATERLLSVSRLVRAGGATSAMTLGVVATVVSVNAVRLTVLARRQEIEIMRLVGASSWFVRLPFVVEGVLQGVIAGACATVLWAVFYPWFVGKAQQAWPFLPVVSPGQVLVPLAGLLLAGGLTLGVVGAALAVGRFLRP